MTKYCEVSSVLWTANHAPTNCRGTCLAKVMGKWPAATDGLTCTAHKRVMTENLVWCSQKLLTTRWNSVGITLAEVWIITAAVVVPGALGFAVARVLRVVAFITPAITRCARYSCQKTVAYFNFHIWRYAINKVSKFCFQHIVLVQSCKVIQKLMILGFSASKPVSGMSFVKLKRLNLVTWAFFKIYNREENI